MTSESQSLRNEVDVARRLKRASRDEYESTVSIMCGYMLKSIVTFGDVGARHGTTLLRWFTSISRRKGEKRYEKNTTRGKKKLLEMTTRMVRE
jgi:hypothetical protein